MRKMDNHVDTEVSKNNYNIPVAFLIGMLTGMTIMVVSVLVGRGL